MQISCVVEFFASPFRVRCCTRSETATSSSRCRLGDDQLFYRMFDYYAPGSGLAMEGLNKDNGEKN